MRDRDQVSFFYMQIYIFQVSFMNKRVFSTMYVLVFTVEEKVGMDIYFFKSVPLFCLFLFLFIINVKNNLKSCVVIPPTFLCAQNCFDRLLRTECPASF